MGLLDMVKDHGGGVVGQLTKKFGVSADQAKQVLDKAIPFVKDKIGGKLRLPGSGTSLLGSIKSQGLAAYAEDPSKLDDDDDVRAKAKGLLGDHDDEQEAQVNDIAASTGLDPAVVRQMLPHAAVATVGAMDADGALDQLLEVQDNLMDKLKALGAMKKDA